jgi:gas vesicle protein
MHRRERLRLRDIVVLLAGIGIGSGVGLLLAPSSGEELRYAIGRGYRKSIKNMNRHAESLRDRAEDLLDHAKQLRELGFKLARRYRAA